MVPKIKKNPTKNQKNLLLLPDKWGDFIFLAQYADDAYNPKFQRRNGQNFPCQKCGKWYSTRSIMLRHMNHECGVEKKIVCKMCQKKFRRKWNLEQHLKRVHMIDDWTSRNFEHFHDNHLVNYRIILNRTRIIYEMPTNEIM